MVIQCISSVPSLGVPHCHPTVHISATHSSPLPSPSPSSSTSSAKTTTTITRRTSLSVSILCTTTLSILTNLSLSASSSSAAKSGIADFFEIPNSGGVKALELRVGTGPVPVDGDQVAIHYYGRLAAKQGWRFDSTYDHKDETGEPTPFVFTLGSGKVISGIEAAVRSMKASGLRRVIIPPSQGYQNMLQEPVPPNFFDRQRLFTTIFNPTRLANGEGSTLGTLIFDIELVSVRH